MAGLEIADPFGIEGPLSDQTKTKEIKMEK
jgi:hypothetical protein